MGFGAIGAKIGKKKFFCIKNGVQNLNGFKIWVPFFCKGFLFYAPIVPFVPLRGFSMRHWNFVMRHCAIAGVLSIHWEKFISQSIHREVYQSINPLDIYIFFL